MRIRSVRGQVTAGYLLVLGIASIVLTGGGWLLLSRSVQDATDRMLRARLEGVRMFVVNSQQLPGAEELRDEFREYAELTMGESMLEVRDPAGDPLCQPTVAWWPAIRQAAGTSPDVSIVPAIADGRPFRIAAGDLNIDGHVYRAIVAVSIAPSEAALARFGLLLAMLVPSLLLLAAAGGYWVTGRALAPVDRMTRSVQAITLKSLNRRVDVPAADDELRRLADTFNDMLERLEAAVADVVRFTAEASHELRTPVARLRTMSEIALSRERTPEQYRQVIADVKAEAERMSTLVDDLLALARSDAMTDDGETVESDLIEVASQAVAGARSAADRQGVLLEAALPSERLPVRGDERSLGRIMAILLDNAVKYSAPGDRVRVAIDPSQTNGSVRLTVADTGPGIDPADAPRIFDRFYRGQAVRAGVVDGSGLGLSIARTIARRVGGSIDLVASGQARGCTIEVVLPLRARATTHRTTSA